MPGSDPSATLSGMRLLLLLAAVAAAVLIGREFTRTGGEAERAATSSAAGGSGRVVLYTTSWCGYCRKARDFLRRHGVTFVEKDIESDPGAARELARKRRGARLDGSGVPVIDVDGKLVQGFSERTYARLLGAL